MDEDIIRAYLWQDIIRLGFSPSGTREQKNWLFQYGQSLKEFWEVETYPNSPTVSGEGLAATIDVSMPMGLIYEYFIENTSKFTVRVMYAPPLKGREFMWEHDMDGQYFSFPNQTFLSYKQRRSAIERMDLVDIGNVIDSLIIHPTPHQHIESPVGDHAIRVGGGLQNPFLYLFHLRVQFCLDDVRRTGERNRLISIFETAIREDSQIAVNDLMRIPPE